MMSVGLNFFTFLVLGGSLTFLDLWAYHFQQIWEKIFNYYFFKYYFCPLSLVLSHPLQGHHIY